jgi:hypothetical protein
MMVLNDECKICKCVCNAMQFQQNFASWTSGNDDIDKFIQNTQLSTHNDAGKALKWIPYNRFYDIKCITDNKFGKVYRANWIDGSISYWFVTLKSLDNPNNITLEYKNEVF